MEQNQGHLRRRLRSGKREDMGQTGSSERYTKVPELKLDDLEEDDVELASSEAFLPREKKTNNDAVDSSSTGDEDEELLNEMDQMHEPSKALLSGSEEELAFIPGDLSQPVESFLSIFIQIFFPFLVAGFGMVGAGLVLDKVQHWEVFERITEIFILVPALLGLKGNLEMTLASRLSTHANLGRLDTKEGAKSIIISNLALVECQAIVVGFLASLFAMVMGWLPEQKFSFDHALLLCAASLVTASFASLALGLVMVIVIVCSRKFRINPDNVATPIAASLGDLVTLVLLSWIASLLYEDLSKDKWLAPVIIVSFIFLIPLCIYVAKSNEHTEKVLYSGWTPVLLAMVISSVGGLILDKAVLRFRGIAVFQPVMNGVGGNLVAVQASRLSTYLHAKSTLGVLPTSEGEICLNPFSVLFGSSIHSRTSRILMLMVIPGQLLFAYTISFLEAGHTTPTAWFLAVYLIAAVIQVWILLHTAQWLIFWFWTLKIDPDNSAIPYLTALGDLLGGVLLALAFEFLSLTGKEEPNFEN